MHRSREALFDAKHFSRNKTKFNINSGWGKIYNKKKLLRTVIFIKDSRCQRMPVQRMVHQILV